MTARALALSSLALMFGCGSEPASAPVTPTASVAPTATASVAAPAPAGKSPFFATTSAEDGHLYDLGGAAFLVLDRFVIRLDGDDLHVEPELLDGFARGRDDTMFYVAGLGGHWPDAAFAAIQRPSGRGGLHDVMKWSGHAWKHVVDMPESFGINAFAPWTEGRTLLLLVNTIVADYEFKTVGGRPGKAPPEPAMNDTPRVSRMMPSGFATLPSGEIFVAGVVDSTGDSAYFGLERFAAGGGPSTIDRLIDLPKGAQLFADGIWPKSVDELWLSIRILNSPPAPEERVNLRVAKKTVTRISGAELLHEALTPIEGVYRTDGTRLYVGEAGAWKAVVLPTYQGFSVTPVEVVSRGPGDAWLLGAYKEQGLDRQVLFHTRPPSQPFIFPTDEDAASVFNAKRRPSPPSPRCSTPFVMLYTVSKTAPADYDFPATRAALKGHREFRDAATFIEFKLFDQRFLGARARSFDVAKKLADLVRAKVPGAAPQVACHDPEATRTLEIDLASGSLKK